MVHKLNPKIFTLLAKKNLDPMIIGVSVNLRIIIVNRHYDDFLSFIWPFLEDEMVWTLGEVCGFLVRSLYTALDQDSKHIFSVHFVWKTLAPSTTSFFMWLLWWDRAPRVDNLI